MNRANWQREEPEVQRKAAAFNRWHEPDDARVSSPDLLEARSEIPWAYSAIATEMGYPRDVRFPPDSDHIADAQTCRKGAKTGSRPVYSITLSASASNFGGISSLSALAVLRFITSSNFADCSIGRSVVFIPLTIFPT